jgi:hypothetical protein
MNRIPRGGITMNHEMTKRSETGNCSRDGAGLSRRAILSGAVAGFALTASGLFLPETGEVAAARDGALQGAKGGRHGKDHKGRHRRRTHGDKKDKGKHGNEAPPQDHGPFRATALTVINQRLSPQDCTFFYRIKTGLDDYALPTPDGDRTLLYNESFRYDPDRYRVGVLLKNASGWQDLYADVRNLSFWFPRGGVSVGDKLDPHNGKFGSRYFAEQEFSVGDVREDIALILKRNADSAGRIEWQLILRR